MPARSGADPLDEDELAAVSPEEDAVLHSRSERSNEEVRERSYRAAVRRLLRCPEKHVDGIGSAGWTRAELLEDMQRGRA